MRTRKTGPSIGDVAKLAGVSAQTVSRVSTGAAAVRPATRAKVLAAMDQLGYSPNRAARALRMGRFGTIGLIAHGLGRTGESRMVEAVAQAAAKAGFGVTLLEVEVPDGQHWNQAALRLSSQAIDGLIIVRAETATPDSLALPPKLPVVVSDSRLVGHYPTVTSDQVEGPRLATAHLLDLGHAVVHHVAGPIDSDPALARRASWERTLRAAGIEPPAVWQGDWTAASGYAMGVEIARDPSITAVLCGNDEMSVGLVRALREAGRDVPRDVSVVGIDGIALGEFLHPPLTTVRQDFERLGRELVSVIVGPYRGRCQV